MARVCEVSGKKTQWGNQVTRRGLPKAKGGVGLKTTGITRRSFRPNIQTVRVLLPNGGLRRMKLAASVIKKGEVTLHMDGRVVTVPLVKAPHGRQREYLARKHASEAKSGS
jgi:large subunit ribosomal protein L28